MKRMISCLLALLLILLLPIGALAAVDVVNFTPDFYVADYANVLSDEVEGLVVLNNEQLDNACGAQIVVVTVDSVRNTSSIDQYASALFQQWGIGDSSKGNGLLMLIAVQDNKYHMIVGKGLQDYITLTDLDGMVSDYFAPSAQGRNFDEAVRQLFGACFDKISTAYDAGLSVDDSLYYKWNQSGAMGTNGAKFLSAPLRDMTAVNTPTQNTNNTPSASAKPADTKKENNGFNILPFALIAVALVALMAFMAKRQPVQKNAPATRSTPANGKRASTGTTRTATSGTRTTTGTTRSTSAGGTRTTTGTTRSTSAGGTRTTTGATRSTSASGTRTTASATRSTSASGTRTTASTTRSTSAGGTRTTSGATRSTSASGTRTTTGTTRSTSASGTRTTTSATRSTSASGTRTTTGTTRSTSASGTRTTTGTTRSTSATHPASSRPVGNSSK